MTQQRLTKIERVTEGVESLATAVAAVQLSYNRNGRIDALKNREDARAELRDALLDLLTPVMVQ